MLTFINCKVLDGTERMTVAENVTVRIDNNKIVYIGEDKSIPSGAAVIDLNGRFLMPGLINLHCHLPSSGKPFKVTKDAVAFIQKQLKSPIGRYIIKRLCWNTAKSALLGGVTTIRTVGGFGSIDSKLRDEINAGKKIGPRILASNMAVTAPKGHMAGTLAYIANSKEEAAQKVRLVSQDRPDLIKLMVTGGVMDAEEKGEPGVLRMPAELVEAASKEAHALGYKVAGHVESPEGVRVALENGVDTIEHGAVLNETHIRLFKEKKAAFICTISPLIPILFFPPEMEGMSELLKHNGEIVFEGITKGAKIALENGIPVGLGSDGGTPYVTSYDFWRELDYFCRYVGVTPAFALYTATLKNAEIAGIAKEVGSIEVGKSADFLITDKNPLDDFSAMREPYMVVARGRVFRHPKAKRIAGFDEKLDSARLKLPPIGT